MNQIKVDKTRAEVLKSDIFKLVEEYYKEVFEEKKFVPGKSHVPVSGKVFDHDELNHIVESALDGWFTTGRFNEAFESQLAKFINTKRVITVNSGSSANLVAFAALTSPELGDRRLKPGDEFISVAVSFPTTINPAIQYGLKPVFLDVKSETYNIDIARLEEALSEKTKAIIIAHTLGNPFDVEAVSAFAKKLAKSFLLTVLALWVGTKAKKFSKPKQNLKIPKTPLV